MAITNEVFVVWFKNLTSDTVVGDNIKMLSFTTNGCCIQLPVKTCSRGHQILLRLNYESSKKSKSAKKIEITGNITELAPIDETLCEVTIHFNQYIKEEWQAILDKFEIKQEKVTSLIAKLKKI